MSENTNERLNRYAEVGDDGLGLTKGETEAELRAEVERLNARVETLMRQGDLMDLALLTQRIRGDEAEAERDRARSLAATLEARLAQVEALHVPCSEHPTCADDDHFCHECGQSSPCTTVRFIRKGDA